MQPSIQPYHEFNGKICVAGIALTDIGIISQVTWDNWVKRIQGGLVRKGGNGRCSLFDFHKIPTNYRSQIVEKFGDPVEKHNALEIHFKIDGTARMFYDGFQFEDNTRLKPEQINQYTLNASVLNALASLKRDREAMRRRLGNAKGDIWGSLIADLNAFQNFIKKHYGGMQHTLPKSRLEQKLRDYMKCGYGILIDGRNKNANAQVVTPIMIQLWNDMFATQRHKPSYNEIAFKYKKFLDGLVDIVNSDTGEVYDRKSEEFKSISESSVYNYLSDWENRIITHSKRSGDRQKFKSIYEPYHKLKQPEFASSIISVDDRQPPFEYATGKRMWFYNAIDLGSEAFTCWVYGESKEGIITDFYRQLVRNYAEWNLPIPFEIEGEASLNSSFTETFLKAGAMFQEVRIEANNARGKRIEAYYRPLRYMVEKKREGWLARPFALSESNQKGSVNIPVIPKDQIIIGCLKDIQNWNNTLHSNQTLHPGMTRWDVFMDKQHPNLLPTNWAGILPHLGYCTKSSMRAGRITLQGLHRVVGMNGEVALGETLINIMKEIEGQEVNVYWIDDNAGNVLKALVYNMEGRLICDLLDDLSYHRSKLERTPQCEINRELTSAYTATVQGYVAQSAKKLSQITIIENEVEKEGRFKILGLPVFTPSAEETKILPPVDDEKDIDPDTDYNSFKTDTKSRF